MSSNSFGGKGFEKIKQGSLTYSNVPVISEIR